MMEPLNRRALLGSVAIVGAVAAVPVLAHAQAQTRRERIQLHAEALAALIREEAPTAADRAWISIGYEFDGGRCNVSAQLVRRSWEADDRLRGGGLHVDRIMGQWRPERGLERWGVN